MSLSITETIDPLMSMSTRAESLMGIDGKQEPAGKKKKTLGKSRVWQKKKMAEVEHRLKNDLRK